MSFLDIQVNKRYRSSDTENIAESFLGKVLPESVCYKRAVGFFSSSSLIYTSYGLAKIAERYTGGPPIIQYIVSPKLDEEDIIAISKGYKDREKVIENALERSFTDISDKYGKERLNMIAHLISSGVMDIKIAIMENNDSIGMYHEKMGIMYDSEGRKIAFEGSLNESLNAYINNFESIQVFRSWLDQDEDCLEIEYNFEKLWNDNTKKVKIYPFPKALNDKLLSYKKESYDKMIDEHEMDYINEIKDFEYITKPSIPKNIILHDYQKEAIENWWNNKCRGIFDMATGTGKTYTAYGAIVTLLKKANYKMATIILCPYQHLVEQWVEDAPKFNINKMIIGYSNPKYSNYLSELKRAVQDYNDGIIDHFFFICTNATFKLDKVQNILSTLNASSLLVADEAHNLGTYNMKKCLLDNKYRYRLALSATVERYRDEEGTQQILDYFGKKCIEYTMERAIEERKLTKYKYHPIVSILSIDEIEEYIRLTEIIKKNSHVDKNGKVILTKYGEQIAIKRARLIAGCKNKLDVLEREISDHITDKNMLIYCGTSKLENDTGEEIKQIDEVTSMLGLKFNMRIGRYTSMENVEERQEIKRRFENGDLQALVAIKCLDEGVNIPGIKTAYILASSTNPREYIQRRGRVLRLAPNKDFAVIYDFVTLPFDLDNISEYSMDIKNSFKTLAKNEINRIKEFSHIAMNESESLELINKINNVFDLNKFETNSNFEEIEWNLDDYE